ncbi:Na+/H+ antiporter subunit E [Fodinicurvata fenggangensis]|uniref:Na+/H+ antiporter subunit E n=1 Tax=Fodinicurvata fenggangensis TaxID=1121830 RepID=UPI00047A2288|nr:Na+/H+ antiporter subunit E [Fodinicurvata fenggangensis]
MIRKVFPHPIMTAVLTLVWMMLMNAFTPATFVLGLILGIILPILTSCFWPDRPTIRNPLKVAEYIIVVLYDIVVANVQVAYLILFRRNRDLRSRFFTVPLEIRTPEAIAILAGTITMTPGTVSSDISTDGKSLLVHGLNVTDEQETVTGIKSRYEKRLKDIFE